MNLTIKYPARIEKLNEILGRIEKFVIDSGCEDSRRLKFVLMAEELVVNVKSYAYEGPDGEIDINMDDSDGTLKMTITDKGREFNPLEAGDPDVSAGLSERKQGGLGIFFVKQIADSVEYKRENDANVIVISFSKTEG